MSILSAIILPNPVNTAMEGNSFKIQMSNKVFIFLHTVLIKTAIWKGILVSEQHSQFKLRFLRDDFLSKFSDLSSLLGQN